MMPTMQDVVAWIAYGLYAVFGTDPHHRCRVVYYPRPALECPAESGPVAASETAAPPHAEPATTSRPTD